MQATSAGFCYLIRAAAAAACEKGDEREEVDNDFDKIKVVQIPKPKRERRDVTLSEFSLPMANSALSPPYIHQSARPFQTFLFSAAKDLRDRKKSGLVVFAPYSSSSFNFASVFLIAPRLRNIKKKENLDLRGADV